jgi:hypothetical protein
VSEFVIVKDVNEDMVIVHETAGDVRLWEALVSHSVVVYSQNFIDINFIFKYFFFCSGRFFEIS